MTTILYSDEHILSVTPGGILYRDEQGTVQWLDFARCNRNWLASRRNLTLYDFRCVGWWHHFPTYYEFASEPVMRFDITLQDEQTIDDVEHHMRKPMGDWHLEYVVP